MKFKAIYVKKILTYADVPVGVNIEDPEYTTSSGDESNVVPHSEPSIKLKSGASLVYIFNVDCRN